MAERKSFLTTKKGYYVYGFSTTINKATQKDVDLAESYGIELISNYESITPSLLIMVEKEHASTLSTQTNIYQVRTGILIMGELRITVQVLPRNYYRITYVYNYRTNIHEFRKANNIKVKKPSRTRTRYRNSYKNRKKYRR